MVSIAVTTFGVCVFSRLALAALALMAFGAYDSYPLLSSPKNGAIRKQSLRHISLLLLTSWQEPSAKK